jgi:RNA polymerase sigma factor (sigma-70 family)
MKPYSAECAMPPISVEPGEPAPPTSLSPRPYEFEATLKALAEHHSGDPSGRLAVEDEQAMLADYAKSGATGIAAGKALLETHARFANSVGRGSLGIPQWRKSGSGGSYIRSVRLASHYAEESDRMQNANLMLTKALKSFDLEKGKNADTGEPIRFNSHANKVMVGGLRRLMDHEDIRETLGPRVPSHTRDEIFALQKKHQNLDLEAIAYEGDFDLEERLRILDMHQLRVGTHHVLLDDLTFPHAAPEETWDSCEEPEALQADEIIPDPAAEAAIVAGTEHHLLSQALNNMIAFLEPREQEIIRLQFGLDGEEPKTQKEIGEIVGLGRSRIGQLSEKTLGTLRSWLQPIKEELFASLADQAGNTAALFSSVVKTDRTQLPLPLPGRVKKQ